MSKVSLYSRENPSPRYQILGDLYRHMHREGETQSGQGAAELYQGRSLLPHLETVRSLVHATGARTVLDYGSGKGAAYKARDVELKDGRVIPSIREYLGVEHITCFDPGVPEYSTFPNGKFDGVVSTDVLEHCPEEDMDWIVEEMFAAANKFVFANVASYPAKKILPNGENAHCTQRPAAWWKVLLARTASRHPAVTYRFEIKERSALLPTFLARAFGRRFKVTVLSNKS